MATIAVASTAVLLLTMVLLLSVASAQRAHRVEPRRVMAPLCNLPADGTGDGAGPKLSRYNNQYQPSDPTSLLLLWLQLREPESRRGLSG